jgi:hypothetical protein
MKKSINEELNSIKFLFKYKAGKVLSEQEQFESEDVGFEEIDLDEEYDDVDMDTRTPEERERDMLDIDMDTRTPEERERNMSDRHMDTGEDLAPSFDSDGNFLGMVKPNRDGMEVDGDLIENRELEVPVKPGTKTPTKPDKDSPYKPKPGPKKAPKAKMPKWLSFAAIGVNIN